MGPFLFFGETGEKTGCGNGAPPFASNIGHVCKIAVELFLVLFPERQPPGFIVAAVAGA